MTYDSPWSMEELQSMIDSALGELGFGKNVSKELNEMETSLDEKKGTSWGHWLFHFRDLTFLAGGGQVESGRKGTTKILQGPK